MRMRYVLLPPASCEHPRHSSSVRTGRPTPPAIWTGKINQAIKGIRGMLLIIPLTCIRYRNTNRFIMLIQAFPIIRRVTRDWSASRVITVFAMAIKIVDDAAQLLPMCITLPTCCIIIVGKASNGGGVLPCQLTGLISIDRDRMNGLLAGQ